MEKIDWVWLKTQRSKTTDYSYVSYADDQRRKAETERRSDRLQQDQEFEAFLDHLDHTTNNRLEKAGVYKKFWADQCRMMAEKRQEDKDFEKRLQDDRKRKDLIIEDEIERYAEDLTGTQRRALKPTYPIERAKLRLGLEARAMPALVASDESKIRMFPTPKDIFYRPEEARERMSINWDPIE